MVSSKAAPFEVSAEAGNARDAAWLDDDGRPRRSGTVWTASAHIVTAVIGSGVLSLAWAIAQLGWAAGPAVMLLFAFVIYYTSTLLAECYRSGDPVAGKRSYTYMDAVRASLGGAKVRLCGAIQYANLFGVAIGYTIAASISMRYGDQEGGLLPQQGAQEPVPELEQPLHDPLRRRRGRLLADTGLRPDMVALHRRRRHVLHLLRHRPRARRHADRRQRRVQGQPHRRRHRRRCHFHPEGLAQPAGLRQHRLRLLLLYHPHRDPGHDQGAAAVGGDGDEEGDDGERGDDDGLLHAVRVHGVRGVRRRRPGQPPHGVRLLRALLAPRRRQRRHRRAPRRRLPGLLPAHLRLRREVGGGGVARQRLRLPGAEGRALRPQRVPTHLAHGVRVPHHRRRHAPPLLRRRRGAPRRRLLLAAHRLLPHRDVRRAARRAQGEHAMGLPAAAQRRLPPRVRRRRRRLHRRRHRRAQGVPPVQRLVVQFRAGTRRVLPWACVVCATLLTVGPMCKLSCKEMENKATELLWHFLV